MRARITVLGGVLRPGLLAALLAGPLAAATWVSAPGGDDQGPGSKQRPFATMQRGLDALAPGDTLLLRSGTYHEHAVVSHSGGPLHPIQIKAYPGEHPLLDGALTVSGPFTPYRGAIQSAPWPDQPLQVFCDGRLLNEARWPHAAVEGLSRQVPARTDAGSATGMACAALPDLDLVGALIQIMPGQSWCAYTRSIVRQDRQARTLAFDRPIQAMAPLVPRRGDRFYVFGKLDLLGAPGEWYWDPAARRLYVWTPDSGPAGGRVEAGRAGTVLGLDGAADVQVSGLRALGGGISLRGSVDCVVRDCALVAPNWTREMDGYDSSGVGRGAVALSGSGNLWMGGSIREAGRCGVLLGGDNNVVLGAAIEDGGWNWGDDAAVALVGATDCLVQGCTIRRMARTGVSQSGGGPDRILHNRIEEVALYSADIGSFDAWGTDGKGTEIAYNLCRGNHAVWSAGIYLDDHARNFNVHDNRVEDMDWYGIIVKDVNRIERNTVLGAGHEALLYEPSQSSVGVFEPVDRFNLRGARVAHNRLAEAQPVRVALAGGGVADYGYWGGYAFLAGGPGRVELDFDALDQPWWAVPLRRDLSWITAVLFSVEVPSRFRFAVSHLRLLPLGGRGDEGAVPLEGVSWSAGAGKGSTTRLSVQGPPAWGAEGESVELGWNVLSAGLPEGGRDLSRYRGLAFKIEGRAAKDYGRHGCEAEDNGPEALAGRGAAP